MWSSRYSGCTELDASDRIAQRLAETGRACGTCSLCCKLLDVPVLKKPAGKWCEHCKPGKGGCSIYLNRPQTCRTYACAWLTDPSFGDEWFPPRAGMFADLCETPGAPAIFRVHVDRRDPVRWRKEPWHARIRAIARRGLDDNLYRTIVYAAGRTWLVLADTDTEIQGRGVLVRTADGGYQYHQCDSEAELKELGLRLNVERAVARARREHPNSDVFEIIDHAMAALRPPNTG